MPAEYWPMTYRLQRMAERLKLERARRGERVALNLLSPWPKIVAGGVA